jgi:anaerobic selenocysteine-containing dehydrogenase
MTTLMRLRRRGCEVVVINPVVETGLVSFRVPSNVRSLLFGSRIATLYVQPHIGGDLALLTGVAKRIDEMGARDDGFLHRHSANPDDWLSHLRATPWSEIESRSGVARDQIDAIAEDTRRRRTWFSAGRWA